MLLVSPEQWANRSIAVCSFCSTMDSEYDQDMSLEQRITKDLTSRKSHIPHKTFRKGVVFGFPLYRVVLLCLTLLDTALLIVALALGMNCAKVKDFQQVTDSALAPLVIERDFLRNQSNIIKEKQTAQMELESQRRAHMELKVQIKQLQVVTDGLQSHIQELRAEKTQLEGNRSLLENNCGRCPPAWLLFKNSCYYYSTPPSNSKKNWADSRTDCISRGGDLLVINNLDEQMTINNNYPKITATGPQWKTGFWIGLTDTVSNGAWVWVNNSTENNTMYWQTDQPSNEESLSGHCAAFARNVLSWKSWYNRNCENDELNWICEMELRCVYMYAVVQSKKNDLTMAFC